MNPAEPESCPYKGLAPFEEQDYPYFFGRDSETRLIIANLFASPVTVLYGPSGVGKSSVLRAGAIQKLRSNPEALPIAPFSNWHQQPLRQLTQWIASAAHHTLSLPESFDSLPLADMIRTLSTETGRRVIIVLDQFEEYFLYHQKAGRFGEELGRAVLMTDGDAGFMISLREDALARLDAFEQCIPGLFETILRVEHLTEAAARDAIVKPLARYNERHTGQAWAIEESLVDQVLSGIGGGVYLSTAAEATAKVRHTQEAGADIETPYLQLVMTRLWDEEVRADSRRLRSETYQRLGGAEEIVRTHVEAVLNSRLTEDERRMAFQIFHYLVTPSRSKVAHCTSDLASYAGVTEDEMRAMLMKLVGGRDRILRTVANPVNPADERYEIFHDRLAAAILEWRGRYTRESIAAGPERAPLDVSEVRPSEGVALCLSGGGYRSVLFHVGAFWRLNEAGLLGKLAQISSVSGGSIAAGVLGLRWANLTFVNGVATNFESEIVNTLCVLAARTLDRGLIMRGLLLPGSVADRLVQSYRKWLFQDATLQDLPDEPRFVFTATNVQTGALFRFSRPYVADYRIGTISNPRIPLAVAVAASSAYPPVLSPLTLELDPTEWSQPGDSADLHKEPYLSSVMLTDGGVYDHLALESAWRKYQTILVSDAGGRLHPEEKPHTDWARHAVRINDLADKQVRDLRKRQIIDSFQSGDRKGAYWSIRSVITDYPVRERLDCPVAQTAALATFPVRLASVPRLIQQRLINWGYAVCDAALRSHFNPAFSCGGFPYPEAAVGDVDQEQAAAASGAAS